MLPFPLLDQRPAEFDGLLFDFWWDLDKLHALDLPVARVSVASLTWQLDLPWWRDADVPFAISPAQVAADPVAHPGQYQRTVAADLSHPIIVRRVRDQLVVLDGVHRLLRAHLNGASTIEAALFDESLIPRILHEPG